MRWRRKPPALCVSSPEAFGSTVFKPTLFVFMAWLLRHRATGRLDRLYFASCEGWALRDLYAAMAERSGLDGSLPGIYLHGARRALLAAEDAFCGNGAIDVLDGKAA